MAIIARLAVCNDDSSGTNLAEPCSYRRIVATPNPESTLAAIVNSMKCRAGARKPFRIGT